MNDKIGSMLFSKVYGCLVSKAERKGRDRSEVDRLTSWLTGYTSEEIRNAENTAVTYSEFFSRAPAMNPERLFLKGTICGVRLQDITDPFERDVRCLDKLVDELAKGREVEKILERKA